MKVLVFGGHGQAGTEFSAVAAGADLTVCGRGDVDVHVPGSAAKMISATVPDLVVNLTAFHVLEQCERDFDGALATNARAVREMASAARDSGAWFVTVSTDYVFDGTADTPYAEDAPVSPLQAYGISKVAGEFAALSALPERAIVVRTCGLYGDARSSSKGRNFVDKRLADAKGQDTLEVGCDLISSPTSAASFAEAMWRLIVHPERSPGIYHLTAEGSCNWAEFTAAIYEIARLSTRVKAVDRRGQYGIVRRPAYSVLANTRARALGIVLPHWRDQLVAYLT
jgi:dTDP-4-dehydrorhamnose reductase